MRDQPGVSLGFARQEVRRVVEHDGLTFERSDHGEAQTFVKSRDRDIPRGKRVIADSEDRKAGTIAVNQTCSGVGA